MNTKLVLSGLALLVVNTYVHAAVINEQAAIHDSIANAQSIDAYFSTDFNANVDNEFNVNTSGLIPWVSIYGNGDTNTFDSYKFHIATANSVATFDIDQGMYDLDSWLNLYSASGSLLAQNDDGYNQGWSGSAHSYDSFLSYNFAATGDYIIQVGRYANSSLYAGQDYSLQVSIQNHSVDVPEPSLMALIGLGLLGLLARHRKQIN